MLRAFSLVASLLALIELSELILESLSGEAWLEFVFYISINRLLNEFDDCT